MILLEILSLDGKISAQTSPSFHGIRIDSTLVGGTIGRRTCCCWTGMPRPRLCAIGSCLRWKPAAAGITTTNRTRKTDTISKDLTNRRIHKFLQIPKPKKTRKRENVLSMIVGVVLEGCAMLLFSCNNSQLSTSESGSSQTQTAPEKLSSSTAKTKPLP